MLAANDWIGALLQRCLREELGPFVGHKGRLLWSARRSCSGGPGVKEVYCDPKTAPSRLISIGLYNVVTGRRPLSSPAPWREPRSPMYNLCSALGKSLGGTW